jgi:hypothetical protein
VRREAVVEFLRRNLLYFSDDQDLRWAQKVCGDSFTPAIVLADQARAVKFLVFGNGDETAYANFLLQCPNIKELAMSINLTRLPATVNMITQSLDLQRLRDGLRHLDAFEIYWLANTSDPRMQHVETWMRQGVLE